VKQIRKSLAKRLFPDRARFAVPPPDAATRRAAWFDFLFVDFGILRLFWKNRARIAPGAIRMNQPYPADIVRAARRGIRTVLTARHDPRHGGNALVAEACAGLGLEYATFAPLFSRSAPTRELLLSAWDILPALKAPVLIHCKSGADRAGFLAALWLIVVENRPVREAKAQLTLKHLHIRASRTGILDAVFDAYLAAHPDERVPFRDWVAREYDPVALEAGYRAGGIADFIDRIILRHE
jgi:protein tyrosine phosphatase (PTP) superfamily phosphohydrolase (DUF442 family)